VITTPVSQTADEHEPDYEIYGEGHVNNWDPATLRRLVGPDAKLASFRCNATFALIAGGGRNLPAPFRDWLYRLDLLASRRLGSPTSRIKPLRNRDWIVTVPAGGDGPDNPPRYACPHCRGGLVPDGEDALVCRREGRRFGFIADDVPDFFATGGDSDPA
jgi:hypothetical protein